MGWASGASSARDIGPAWAAASEAPVVRGAIEPPTLAREVDLPSLLASGGREVLLEIKKELDGPATGFGARLRAMLVGKSPEMARVLTARLSSLTYSDRYIFNPIAVRLVTELLGGFVETDTKVKVITLAARPDGRTRPGRWIYTDWADLGTRAQVLGQMLAEIAPRAVLDLQNRLGHRRRLDFQTERGAGTIFFDQGVGSWEAAGVAFDHLAPATEQIKALREPLTIVNKPEGTFVAVRLAWISTAYN
jgi:DEAD/DEAH box helicase domain-containing protein